VFSDSDIDINSNNDIVKGDHMPKARILSKPEVKVSVEQGAILSKYANFYSATVSKNEVILLLGEKSPVQDGSADYIVHTKIAMSNEGARKMVELITSLIKKSEENAKK
jgi:hypothetical protein